VEPELKTVIFCGHTSSGCEALYCSAVAMGLSQPVRSARGGLFPDELQEKLLKLSNIDPSGDWLAPEKPGALWHELAADLFLTNVDAKQWGWCENRYAQMLPFWKAFDSQIVFVLAYTPPEYAMAAAIRDGGEALAAMHDWRAFNQAMLRFQMSNQERCVLVNTRASAFSGKPFLALLSGRLNLALAADRWAEQRSPDYALEALLARQILADAADVADIFHSLESVADIARSEEATASEASAALQQLRHYGSQLQERDLRLERQEQEARQQNDMLVAQLRESQAELDRYTQKIEEFLRGQVAGQQSTLDVSAAIENVFDARRGFAGDNWYPPEEDGRWAGPLSVSTVRLPRLAPGSYGVNFDVAATMAPEILESIRCYINGNEIQLEGAWAGCPANLYGEFTVSESEGHHRLELQFQFCRTESPAAQGVDVNDFRELAIRLRSISIRALELVAD
jgi:hypothetical protein